MDSLDKVTVASTKPLNEPADLRDDLAETFDNVVAEAETAADIVADEAEQVARKVNWWAVAGYSAAALAVAGAGYAYWKRRHKTPQTRIERLREQLGLAEVDFRNLRTTARNFDLDRLNESRRHLAEQARKATHKSAKRIAELTR